MQLSRYLLKHGITTQQFAKKMQMSPSTINKWRILNRIPRPSMILKIHKTTRGAVTLKDWT